MDFYNAKRNAFLLIDDLVKEGVDIEIIYFKVSTMYGFGKKLVNDRIEDLKKVTEKVKESKKKR